MPPAPGPAPAIPPPPAPIPPANAPPFPIATAGGTPIGPGPPIRGGPPPIAPGPPIPGAAMPPPIGAACAIGGAPPAAAAASSADARRLLSAPNQRAPGVPVCLPSAVLVPAASPAAVPVPEPAGEKAPHVRTLKMPKSNCVVNERQSPEPELCLVRKTELTAATAPTIAWRTAAMPVITAVTAFATSDMTAPYRCIRTSACA
ncbi:hypothetical protein BV20DRAFT_210204 [Pilatotrama ljubarskyi]|nr:hypothetical protein BV20DRAFT_210204 [Pilatotrama ljubarskyi]